MNRLEFSLYAKRPQYAGRLSWAKKILAEIDLDHAYVSFSAGKDSAVIAHMVHAIKPGIPMLMVDPGCPIHWTESERSTWLQYAADQGWILRLFPWDKYAAKTDDNNAAAYRARIHDSMFDELTCYAQDANLTTSILGLRAEESEGRRIDAYTHGPVYQKKDGTVRCCPIQFWSYRDVWAYIFNAKLPYLSIYDKIGPAARNGLIGRNGIEHGRMIFLRKYYPEAFRYARDILGLDYAQ